MHRYGIKFGVTVMLKKLLKVNHFILGVVLICMIASILYSRSVSGAASKNRYYLRTVQNRYDVYLVNNSYIFASFEGSGGFLSGGIIAKNKISDINLITETEITKLLEDNPDYAFPCESFPKGVFAVGNSDFDKKIEIFAFDVLGTSFLHPVEIDQDGKIKEEGFFTYVLTRLLVSFWTLPTFIIYLFFFTYYIIVCIIYFTVSLKNKRKNHLSDASNM